ncbi:hypothetical protein [Streptomyces sp. NPDC096153]|uniref:hypothetical protein n=1 Tax=Streptomyces sp. NPDC096153 TaxID=3155548 RepID=UPI00332DC762
MPGASLVSRRSVLRALAAAGAGAAGPPCRLRSTPGYVPPGDRAGRDLSGRDGTLDFANWPLCIEADGEDTSRRPTLDAFTERTGISVRCTEEINDNDEFLGRQDQPALMNHQATGRDLVVVSDWMAARFVRLGWVQEMDRDPVRNIWVVEFGVIACSGIIPLALICGPIRGIPFGWTVIDVSFGVFGVIPLLAVRRMIKRLEVLTEGAPAARAVEPAAG